MSQLLRIGEFASLTGVSVKALRYYESEELLQPDYVDPDTGYRYFRIEQCTRLALITNLRAAGFSIAEISELAAADAAPQAILDLVARKRRRLLEDRQDIDDSLAVLATLEKSVTSAADDPLSAVRLTSVAPQVAYTIRATVATLGEPVTALFESAERTVAAVDARAPIAPFLIFHSPPAQQTDLELEVCIPVDGTGPDSIDCRTVEAYERACSVVYAGDYSQTASLREKMLAWIDHAGLEATGPLREVFHRFGADEEGYALPSSLTTRNRDAFITELLLPVSGMHIEEVKQ